uniref:Uncharacterized protein n=1 Tax=Ciona intestinalis TaxID=7719 RepID=H2XXA1_CIOIN
MDRQASPATTKRNESPDTPDSVAVVAFDIQCNKPHSLSLKYKFEAVSM